MSSYLIQINTMLEGIDDILGGYEVPEPGKAHNWNVGAKKTSGVFEG